MKFLFEKHKINVKRMDSIHFLVDILAYFTLFRKTKCSFVDTISPIKRTEHF